MCSISVARTISARFRKLVNSEAEPGHEDLRYSNLQTTFILGTLLGVVLSLATAFLAYLWGTTIPKNNGFIAPCVSGIIAASVVSRITFPRVSNGS